MKNDPVGLLLGQIDASHFCGGLTGIEREALRVTPGGEIAQTPHPEALGSALAHPNITTDFSEAQLELVTPPFSELGKTTRFLENVHKVVRSALSERDELLWPASMPALFTNEDEIPIAQFGASNVGQMKHVYRVGLAHRYGRAMQAISGVHFNYSLPDAAWEVIADIDRRNGSSHDAVAARYFGMLRNFRRHGWLILYLFGCSPAVCKSFFGERRQSLPDFDTYTAYLPYATSLRMSDLGYKNSNQASLEISYNSLDDYIEDLARGISTPNPAYQEIGVQVDGAYRQLNANMLQIENEFYSLIRPKRRAYSGEQPTRALRLRGVEYVEVRALDVNVFDPSGVCPEQLNFLIAFLVWCALEESPPIDSAEGRRIENNQRLAAREGRDPKLQLARGCCAVRLRDWAMETLDRVAAVAEHLDRSGCESGYSSATAAQLERVKDTELTLSARVLREMRENKESFSHFALRYASEHADNVAGPELSREFSAVASESLDRQRDMEAGDTIDFATYLENYFAQSQETVDTERRSA